MRKRTLLAFCAVMLASAAMQGVPARPGFHKVVAPDGSEMELELVGDEHFHYFVTPGGERFIRDGEGMFIPVSSSELEMRRGKALASRVAPEEITRTFPTTGTVRGLVILAEFPECKFREENTREYFDSKINSRGYEGSETFGSVADFFDEQSCGRFSPVFDVVGPVTLPHPASYYVNGKLDLSDYFRDLCNLADAECDVDFSRYDIDDDGFVDFIFSIFAGYSQAQSLNADDIWPAMQYLENFVYELYDDKYLNVAACASELKGASGSDRDGIGTICHEFSHILGLPDIYDTYGGTGYGMGHYDIMDIGTYNGGGTTPAGFTAMDRYTLGWLDPVVLEGTGSDFELEDLVGSNKAAFIVNPENNAEFFTLENRQKTGFDSALPGHGLLVTQVHYDPKIWKKNAVNTVMVSGYEHVRLMAADNNWLNTTEGGDPFPGLKENTSFGPDTKPGAVWHTTSNRMDCPLSNIRETSDGKILFDFGSGAGVATPEGEALSADELIARGAIIYTPSGVRVTRPGKGLHILRHEGKTMKIMF